MFLENNKIVISVVIVTWNGKKYIAGLLESLLRATQHCPCAEIIVVDNASNDGTPDIVQTFKELFGDKLKLIRLKKNTGFAGGNNIGIHLSRGDIVFLLNQDTYVCENSLKEIVSFFKKNSRIGVSQCLLFQYRYPNLLDSCGDLISNSGLGIVRCFGEKDEVLNSIDKELSIARGAALAIRRNILVFSKHLYGTYLPKYFVSGGYEDWYLSILARILKYEVVLLQHCIVYHNSLLLRAFNPYITYNALNLFFDFQAPPIMLIGRVLLSAIGSIVFRSDFRMFIYAILGFLKTLKRRIQTRYYISTVMKINKLSPKQIWNRRISVTEWLKWYITYLKKVQSFSICF